MEKINDKKFLECLSSCSKSYELKIQEINNNLDLSTEVKKQQIKEHIFSFIENEFNNYKECCISKIRNENFDESLKILSSIFELKIKELILKYL